MALTKVDDRGLKTPIDLQDNEQIRLGTGNDFKILHDGTDSYLDHGLGSGLLRINAAAGAEIRLTKSGPETLARFIPDGAVELYHDNSKVFETSSTGVTINGATIVGGNIEINQDAYFKLGAGQDLQFHHGGSSSYITNSTGFLFVQSNDLALRSQGQENFLVAAANGSVDLYYDNSKKFETTSSGIKVTGDASTGTIIQGAFSLRDTTSSSDRIKWIPNSPYVLRWSDNFKASFGSGDDLQIYHSGSSSYIVNNTGAVSYTHLTLPTKA